MNFAGPATSRTVSANPRSRDCIPPVGTHLQALVQLLEAGHVLLCQSPQFLVQNGFPSDGCLEHCGGEELGEGAVVVSQQALQEGLGVLAHEGERCRAVPCSQGSGLGDVP